nr:class I SAM-dependent methyltransferase [uncultured Clostridium sp.]
MDQDIINYYKAYDEEGRLFRNNSHKIEWLTSMHYLMKFIKKESLVLDGCAGTGNYAFPLAELGYKVVAGDIVPGNIEVIRDKQKNNPVLKDVYVGSMLDLSRFSNESFDAVLCMGAFYHANDELRPRIMKECLRVLKPDGLLAVSYINTMAGVLVGVDDDLRNMDEADKWFENRTTDGLFLYMTPHQMEEMALSFHTNIVSHIAADGINYLLSSKINTADEENFSKWYQFHLKTCEDKSLLGYSLHSMIILRK